jgi:cytochrome b561
VVHGSVAGLVPLMFPVGAAPIALHAGAALHHHLVRKDDPLRRML